MGDWKHALFMAMRGFALERSRRPLIRTLLDAGWEVTCAGERDGRVAALEADGVRWVHVPFHTGCRGPRGICRTAGRVRRLSMETRPTFVHLFNGLPVVIGSQFGWGGAVKFATITGLGGGFARSRTKRAASYLGIMLAIARTDVTIFQNPADHGLFEGNPLLRGRSMTVVLGSGVSTSEFRPRETNRSGPVVVSMVSRLLRSKGVDDYLAAAGALNAEGVRAEFRLHGDVLPGGGDAYSEEEVKAASAAAGVSYLGFAPDMGGLYAGTDILVLPTRYREGVPRVVLEAMSCGIPVVATDVPGCRDAIRHESCGLLIEPDDRDALTNAIRRLIGDRGERERMGAEGRRRAVERFDVESITRRYLDLYSRAGIPVDATARG